MHAAAGCSPGATAPVFAGIWYFTQNTGSLRTTRPGERWDGSRLSTTTVLGSTPEQLRKRHRASTPQQQTCLVHAAADQQRRRPRTVNTDATVPNLAFNRSPNPRCASAVSYIPTRPMTQPWNSDNSILLSTSKAAWLHFAGRRLPTLWRRSRSFFPATFTTHLSTTQALAMAAAIKVLVHETTPMWLRASPHLPAGWWTCIHPRSRPLSCPDNTTQLYKGQSLKSLLKNLRPEQNEHVFSYLAKTKDCAFYTVRLKSRSNWVQNV